MLALIAANGRSTCCRHAAPISGKGSASIRTCTMLFLLLSLAPSSAAFAAGSPKVPTARAEPRAGKIAAEFFTSVKAIHDVVIRSAATGILEGFHPRPGDHVTRGERLGYLGGANYAAKLASARAAAETAGKALSLAREQLKVDKARYPLLIDRGALDQGKLKVTRARNTLIHAQETLGALQANGTVTSPVSGTVNHVASSDGERVSPGEKLLTLQPRGRLWLIGSIFAKDIGRVRIGMHGQFHPAGGGTAVPVRVSRIFPRSAGEGLGIGLVAISQSPGWFSGEGGMVTLGTRTGNEPAVPDSALVLDRGQWWVIRDSGGHLEPVRVVPDGSRGGWTWIRSGLKPGTPVVTSGAYLIFHKSFASKYSGD